MLRTSLLAAVASLSALACAPDLPAPIAAAGPLARLTPTREIALDGVALDGVARGTGELLVASEGLLRRFDDDGAPLALEAPPALPPTDDGAPRALVDLAVMREDRVVLLAGEDGLMWDRVTGTVQPYFCLVPAAGLGTELPRENGAVAVDEDLGLVIAAQREIGEAEDGSRTRISQRMGIYRSFTGATLEWTDLTWLDDDIEGLAFTDDGDVLVAAGELLVAMTFRGDVLAAARLEGVTAARGLVRDGDDVFVATADRVLVYDLHALDAAR